MTVTATVEDAIRRRQISSDQIRVAIQDLACYSHGFLSPGSDDCDSARVAVSATPLKTDSLSPNARFPNAHRKIPDGCKKCNVLNGPIIALASLRFK